MKFLAFFLILIWSLQVRANVSAQDLAFMAQAKAFAQNAHIPSGRNPFRVGAVMVTTDGKVFKGANVKLACGLTQCAERVALYKALTQKSGGGKKSVSLRAIYVENTAGHESAPCGVCLQAMSDFATDETLVFFRDAEGNVVVKKYSDMISHPFRNPH